MDFYYITTPIYYVNDIPHLGHAYTSVAADVCARFWRLCGVSTYFVTGVDEHGQKVEKAAQKQGCAPQAFVDKMNVSFEELTKLLNISNDDYIRTTQERHKSAVSALWNILYSKGYIYLDRYEGWYSVRDEAFFTEDELIEGLAPTGAPVEWMAEESYFFKLSAFQQKLLDLYQNEKLLIVPHTKYNEVISFIKSGLKDLSISRTKISWGIKVPQNSQHIIYVWLDALTNYITALHFPNIESDLYTNYWQNGYSLHLMGKDILRFHAVYWPAFLLAAELPLPKKIFAHGWWLAEGQKMSKSLGNVISPFNIVKEFEVDYLRYFLMREISFGNDGNFSKEALINRVNTDLANNIGNLIHRTLTLLTKNFNGVIRVKPDKDELIVNQAYSILSKLRAFIDNQKIQECLIEIVYLSSSANEYMHNKEPWKIIKNNPDSAQQVLTNVIEVIRIVGIVLQPFIPSLASVVLDNLGIKGSERTFSCLTYSYSLPFAHFIPPPTPIFKKFEL